MRKYMVTTMEPGGLNPAVTFWDSRFAAWEHAHKICRDLNRDAYVSEVIKPMYAQCQEAS